MLFNTIVVSFYCVYTKWYTTFIGSKQQQYGILKLCCFSPFSKNIWELIETSRRILLTAVLSVSSQGSSKQNVLSLLLAFIYNKLYGYFQPYEEYSNYQMAEVGQTQIFLTYLAIIVIDQNLLSRLWDGLLEGLLIVVNLGVILLGFYYECISYMEENPDVVLTVSEKMKHFFSSASVGLFATVPTADDKAQSLPSNNHPSNEAYDDPESIDVGDIYVIHDHCEEVGGKEVTPNNGSLISPISETNL